MRMASRRNWTSEHAREWTSPSEWWKKEQAVRPVAHYYQHLFQFIEFSFDWLATHRILIELYQQLSNRYRITWMNEWMNWYQWYEMRARIQFFNGIEYYLSFELVSLTYTCLCLCSIHRHTPIRYHWVMRYIDKGNSIGTWLSHHDSTHGMRFHRYILFYLLSMCCVCLFRPIDRITWYLWMGYKIKCATFFLHT